MADRGTEIRHLLRMPSLSGTYQPLMHYNAIHLSYALRGQHIQFILHSEKPIALQLAIYIGLHSMRSAHILRKKGNNELFMNKGASL